MGGAENLAVRIANALAAEGHQSHLIVVTEPDILSERIHPDVHVHYLEFWRSPIRNPFAFLASILRGLRLLKSVIENEKIQVVQTHLPGANFWGLLLELNKVLPVLATIHNNQEFRYGDRDNQLLAFFRKTAYKQILNRCHGTVAVSEKVRNSLILELKSLLLPGYRSSTTGLKSPNCFLPAKSKKSALSSILMKKSPWFLPPADSVSKRISVI